MTARRIKKARAMMLRPYYWDDRLAEAIYAQGMYAADYYRSVHGSEDEAYALKMNTVWTRRVAWYKKLFERMKDETDQGSRREQVQRLRLAD